MAKKSSNTSKNDTRAASIVLGLFAAIVILTLIFSKSKEQKTPPVVEFPAAVEQMPAYRIIRTQAHHKPASFQQEEAGPATESPGNVMPSGGGAKIAIILDDWGQSMTNCKYLKEIPEPLAVSILPGLRHTKDIAACAREAHKVAMLHLPLEAMHNYDFYPPNYIIKTSMSPELVTKIVDADMDELPSIEGVNNHMGSKATADRALMKVIFKRIKKRDLFFVDSVTSHYTVSAALAGEMGLSYGKRDVFLDNINTKEAIDKQFVALAQRARRHGYAVAIGHDRKVTMQNLKEEINWLEKQGFQIVSIKDLLHTR